MIKVIMKAKLSMGNSREEWNQRDATWDWLKKEYLKKRDRKNGNCSPRPSFEYQ